MGSFVSRRVSEFVGVALFALALMWLISLASYTPADPVWFFTTGAEGVAPLNFGGRVGAFLAELSYQMLGYSAYLAAHRSRRQRLALLLVPHARRRVHEARGRRSALRLCLVISVAGVWHSARRQPGDPRRRLSRPRPGGVSCRLFEQDRLDHPDPDAPLPLNRPVHAVLIRTSVWRALPDGARSLGQHARRHAGAERKSAVASSSARKS